MSASPRPKVTILFVAVGVALCLVQHGLDVMLPRPSFLLVLRLNRANIITGVNNNCIPYLAAGCSCNIDTVSSLSNGNEISTSAREGQLERRRGRFG